MALVLRGGVLRQIRGFAGHSKWQNIRHKKGATDAAQQNLFTKLSRMLEAASRQARGDRNNLVLASAIARARDRSMPKAKITDAVERGTKRDKAGDMHAMTFEATLRGTSLVIEALTDNTGRTAKDVKHIVKKHDGHVQPEGSVTWNWHRLGLLHVERTDEDELLAAALNVDGFEDLLFHYNDTDAAVFTDPSAVASTRDALRGSGFNILAAALIWRPSSLPVGDLSNDAVASLLACLDALDDHPDVTDVFHDADIQHLDAMSA